MNSLLRFIPVALLFILGSCRKEMADVPVLNETSLAGKYRIVSCKEDGIELIHDQTIFKICELDDVLNIQQQGTYEVSEGFNICDQSSAHSGSWSIKGNTFYWDEDDYKVRDFSSIGFTLYYTYSDPKDPSLNYSEEIRLQRI